MKIKNVTSYYFYRAKNKIFYILLISLRMIPTFMNFDDKRYDNIEKMLSDCKSTTDSKLRYNIVLIRQLIIKSLQLRKKYRLIDPQNIEESDEALLLKMGISFRYIKENFETDQGESSVKQNDFQLQTLLSGFVSIVCPFTGKRLECKKSILAAPNQPIYYRFESQTIYYLAVGRAGYGYPKLYLWFPEYQVVILLTDKKLWNGRYEIDEFRAHMIQNWREIQFYFASTASKNICVLCDCGQFAHHLWNALTGINKMIEAKLESHMDKFIIAAEPFGPIDDIFPELGKCIIERRKFENLSTLSIKDNLLLIRLGDCIISNGLIKRVRKTSLEKVPESISESVQEMREKYWPILWVTLRTGNRTWESQCEGIVNIVIDIKKEYPRLSIIIDGFCIPYGKSHIGLHKQNELIEKEQKLVNNIEKAIGEDVHITVTIGKTIAESVVIAEAADCYLAHHGSIQHKIGWIRNCPGVVHSNPDVLKGWTQYIRAINARENPVTPVYLSHESTYNIAGAEPVKNLRWANDYENYEFDYRVARDELLKIIKNIPVRV